MRIQITINVLDDIEAYQAVTDLAAQYAVEKVETPDEVWAFDTPAQAKYFLKRSYIDQETGQQITIND